MEDGFLRSRGLGAALTPPLSLVLDAPSLYYDPSKSSRLDHLITRSDALPTGEIRRAERLIARINRLGLTKYNIAGVVPDLETSRRKILVPGQVEDDASVVLGSGEVKTNLALLEETRARNPDAFILWKPHPDVEAGLREGAVDEADATRLADVTLTEVGAAEAIAAADEVWTITSTLGFETLLRGKPVTCLGMPFYAGRGLTVDLAARPPHRGANVALAGLAHACLIGYPRYFDPRSGVPISPEGAVTLLAEGIEVPRVNKVLAWLQGLVR